MQTFSYPPTPQQEQAVAASTAVLQGLRLRITFDGQPTIDSPLGEFYGSGLGYYRVAALMYSMNGAGDGWMSAWWPMPFRQRAVVQLSNQSSQTVTSAQSEVTSAPDSSYHAALSPEASSGYFHTTSAAAATVPRQDHMFLQAAGRGKFVGVTQTMQGPGYRGYLEGDERVYVDGSRSPQIHGTGTEDFYEGGWYFNRDMFTDPLNGNPAHQPGIFGCPAGQDCTGAYWQMIADAVSFNTSIAFGIEHGGYDDVQANYASTAYWYGQSRAALRWTDHLDVGSAVSEQRHSYTSSNPGAVTTLTDTFEGNDGAPAPVTETCARPAPRSAFASPSTPRTMESCSGACRTSSPHPSKLRSVSKGMPRASGWSR